MNAYLITLLIALSCACDRIRGGGSLPVIGRPLWLERGAKFGQGAILAYLALCPYWLIPVAAVLFWLGEKPGWGYPMGYAAHGEAPELWDKTPHGLEKWQPGFLHHKPYLSLVVRGAIWGALPSLLWFWWHQAPYLAVSMAISMPLSVYLSRFVSKPGKATIYETLRGMLSALLCAATRLI